MTSQTSAGDSCAVVPPRRSWITVGVPVAVGALTLGFLAWSAWPTLRPTRSVQVTQAVFDRAQQPTSERTVGASDTRPRGKTVQAAGWLEAEPYSVGCAALADGVVETIDAIEGDWVDKGDVIARLVGEDSELRLARADAALADARAERAHREAELRAAQSDWDEPVEQERAVEVWRAACEEGEAELKQLASLIASEQATLLRLEEELQRAESSQRQGAATDFEVIVARQRAQAQRASVESVIARGPLLEARLRRSHAELRAAERNLELRIDERQRLQTAEAALARSQASVSRAIAQRDEAALELERMVIRAPISGFVQRRYKSPGDKVVRMMDDPNSAILARLYDPTRMQVRVDVPLADAANVFEGQSCEVVVEVLPDETFVGTVLRITHEADLQKNTLEVKVGVAEPSPLLRPEMLTRVKFLAQGADGAARSPDEAERQTQVLVPEAVLDDQRSTLWAVRDRRGDRGAVVPVSIDVLDTSDGWARVRGPVQPGDLLVVGGPALRDGQRVRVESWQQGVSP